ncbi:MAG TPA: metallophosphoesterase [Tepidisphaeraceae bacterium]|nr:metallophosphoesterase [Tepidisphaeraceae bacterium]
MRLLATADLHFNHPRSKALAVELIERMNRAGGDVLLFAGDTAVADGDALEQCLSHVQFSGPKLFLCGNHELWTRGPDSYAEFTERLPARVRGMGWQWLETDPFRAGSASIVGTIGWYDYGFASAHLGIPERFYVAKVSPAAARYLKRDDLRPEGADVPSSAAEIFARWNDGKFVKLGRTDAAFLDECLARLEAHLDAVREATNVVVATHCVPFRELLPPSHSGQWEFAKGYLGSPRMGELIRRYPNVRTAICGHSHFPAEHRFGSLRAINVGAGYRQKGFVEVELAD